MTTGVCARCVASCFGGKTINFLAKRDKHQAAQTRTHMCQTSTLTSVKAKIKVLGPITSSFVPLECPCARPYWKTRVFFIWCQGLCTPRAPLHPQSAFALAVGAIVPSWHLCAPTFAGGVVIMTHLSRPGVTQNYRDKCKKCMHMQYDVAIIGKQLCTRYN